MLEEKSGSLSHYKGLFLAFLVGFAVRLIPELLSFPNPIGWDTIYYAYRVEEGVLFGFWDNVFSSWMIYAILMILGDLTHLAPFILLKIVASLLFGGASAGVYFVAWKNFNWNVTKCLLVSLILVFSLAALGISWQFYRNVFGIMILLFMIPLIKYDVSWKETAILSVLGLLVAWGHELSTISLFFIIFGYYILSIFRKAKILYKLFLAIIPVLFVFFGNFFLISPYAVEYPINLVWLHDSVWAHPGNLFFLTDYLTVNTPIESYNNYFDLFYQVGSLFLLLYAVLLPLIAIGYFKDRTLNLWTILLLIGSFCCLIVPFAALLLWARWMLMLIVPFSFFAANGLWKATKSPEGIRIIKHLKWLKITKKIAYSLLLIFILMGGLFMVYPLSDEGSGLYNWPGSLKYFPSTMQASSIPLRDTEALTEAYKWINNNMNKNSLLLVHDTFEFWTLLYLDQNHIAYLFDKDLEFALNSAQNDGYQQIYFVWWNQDINWYDIELSDNWVPVFNSQRISIYQTN
jgi:hypothetical protein